MKKALNILTFTLAAAALALTGWTGCRFYRFSTEYARSGTRRLPPRK